MIPPFATSCPGKHKGGFFSVVSDSKKNLSQDCMSLYKYNVENMWAFEVDFFKHSSYGFDS